MALPFVDAHLHVVDPRFPLVANQGYLPPPYPVPAYLEEIGAVLAPAGLSLAGGAVVAGSFQGHGQDHLLDALQRLGPGFAGVAQLPPDTPDGEVARLARLGVRALRANLVRGAGTGSGARDGDLAGVLALAARARALAGWHLELYVRSADLPALLPLLRRHLPDPRALVVDHLGLTRRGFDVLLGLAGDGARVKATGFSRGDLDVPAALRAVHDRNPGALLAGSDLPSTRAARRFDAADLDLVLDAFTGADLRRVLHGNAVAAYRLDGA